MLHFLFYLFAKILVLIKVGFNQVNSNQATTNANET